MMLYFSEQTKEHRLKVFRSLGAPISGCCRGVQHALSLDVKVASVLNFGVVAVVVVVTVVETVNFIVSFLVICNV